MIGNKEGTDDCLTLTFNSETPYSFDHLLSLSLATLISQHSEFRSPREYQQCNNFKYLQFKQDCKKTISTELPEQLFVGNQRERSEGEQLKSRSNRDHLDDGLCKVDPKISLQWHLCWKSCATVTFPSAAWLDYYTKQHKCNLPFSHPNPPPLNFADWFDY